MTAPFGRGSVWRSAAVCACCFYIASLVSSYFIPRNASLQGALVLAVLAGIVWRLRNRQGLLFGALLSGAAFPFLQRFGWQLLFGRRLSAAALLLVVAACAAIAMGLWTAARTLPGRFPVRLAVLVGGAVLPAIAIPARAILPGLGVLLAAATVASLTSRRIEAIPSGRAVIASAAAAIFVFFGLRYAETASRDRAAAEVRRVLSTLPATSPDTPYERIFFQRGVSFTAESAVSYASADARDMLAKLPEYGVNSIALIPFGRTTREPIRITPASGRTWEPDEGIEILTRLAHSMGIKVMLKPHASRLTRDQLPTDAHRAEWFSEFARFLEHYAALAARTHVDLFCIGVEFDWLTQYESEWREVIRRVRAIYPGPLVYAANFGADFENVKFWDALDYIGLDNYYPLPDDHSTTAIEARVEAVHKRFGKPVIFTEAGFSAIENAHREPWADETDRPLSLETQARCYETLLRAFYNKPYFFGVYWWKVGTNGYGGPQNNSMTPWRKPAMDVLRHWYRSGSR